MRLPIQVRSALSSARRATHLLRSVMALIVGMAVAPVDASAVEKAEAAKGPPVSVAIFVSSRTDQCYDNGVVAAITHLVNEEQARINASGGIHGRRLDIKILDDARDDKRAIANVRTALSDPTLLAMIGVSGSSRGKAVFDALDSEIGASNVPFLSDLSVSNLFEKHLNVYTTRASQDEVRAPVMAEFTRRTSHQRAAFVGIKGTVFSDALADSLAKLLGEGGLVADLRLEATEEEVNPQALSGAIETLRAANPDMIFLTAGGKRTPAIIKAFVAANITPALFVTGRITQLPEELTKSYPNAMYQLAWEDLPEIYNNRIRKRIATDDPLHWVFEGKKVAAAPGWAKGECKARPADVPANPLDPENLRSVSSGAQYADMVALVATAARRATRGTDLKGLRAEILERLKTDYAAGRGAFKGRFDNWAFDASSRTATRSPFVIILPQALGRTQLAQHQFARARDGNLRETTTLYVDVDMIKVYSVNENEQSFFAEFYLSMRANDGATLDRIEFANAYVDPVSSKRQLTIETIHGGGKSNAYPESMKIYKVSGRFLFQPNLKNYPLDTQLFTIDLQPKSGDAPFIIQPPPLNLRDPNVITDGWDQVEQYVGTDEDFVPVVDAFTHEPSIAPFYKASFAWMLKRQTTDYILRVVVPLGFILIVAYLSIFIPKSNFEAIVTIQVTALLSAVALYLALPALSSDSATLSDRMFVFVYMLVAAMIAISILRVNQIVATRNWIIWTLDILHVVGIPILVGLASLYVYGLSLSAQ